MAKIFEFPYRTVAEINLQALVKNMVSLRAACRREVIPVIKADAYGHGVLPVAKVLLQRGGAEAVAVATLEEAIQLRHHFDRPFTILVLSGFLPHQIDAYFRYNLIPIIHSLNHLKSLQGRAQLPPLHLKIDTGMNRLGLKPDELPEAMKVLAGFPEKLAGISTHLANSDDPRSQFIDEQIALFESWCKRFREARLLNTDARIHYANSAAIMRDRTKECTAVRPGLSLYGVGPAGIPGVTLYPVLQWKARVISLKNVVAGETVGYGRTFTTEKPERLALISVGYADGYPRILGNQGELLIRGVRAKLCGRVSMDLCAARVTHIPDVKEGDLATLIGSDGKQSIWAGEVASWANTIPYEVFTGISQRVQKIYFDSEAT